jgi:sugar lactone lactonase YvrE
MQLRLHGYRVGALASAALLALAATAGAAPAQKRSKNCTVRGVVRDLSTGKPVPGYRLFVMVAASSRADRPNFQQTLTDSRGAFTLSAPRGSTVTPYWQPLVQTSGETFTLDEAWYATSGPQAVKVARDLTGVTLNVKLRPLRKVRVVVLDAEGRPVEGAAVAGGGRLVTTGSDGAASVAILPGRQGQGGITVTSRDRKLGAQAQAPTSGSELRLTLKPLPVLAGTAVDEDGKPAADLQITWMPMSEGGGGNPIPAVTTDAEGKFRVEAPPSKEYLAYWNNTSDYKQGSTEVTLKEGEPIVIKVVRKVNDPNKLVGSVGLSAATKVKEPSGFCMDPEGNLLIAGEADKSIVRATQDDQLLGRFKLAFAPQCIDCMADGSILVAGQGRIAVLDKDGKELRSGKVPNNASCTAITHWGDDIFVCASGASGFAIIRFGLDLKEPLRIVSGLSGCCGQLDICAREGGVYVALNSAFTIARYSREGRKISSFKHEDAKKPDYFGEGCCEPKNLTITPDGVIFAAASSPMLVNKYSLDGKFLGRAGKLADADGSCVKVTVGVTKDGSKLYMLDTSNSVVRLVKQAPAQP